MEWTYSGARGRFTVRLCRTHLAPLPLGRKLIHMVPVKVLSYNIRSMRDDTAALARVIKACEPDLVLIQEAPRFFRWRKKLARLASASGLVILTGGGTAAGPAILCNLRATVERTEDVLLPLTPGQHRRGFATAVVRFGGARLGVLSCHLSLQEDERHDQAGMLLDRLAANLQDCWATRPTGGEHTWTRTEPRRRIDAIFATKGIEVLGCGVPTHIPGITEADMRAATDHLPVLATLGIPAN